MPTSHIYFWHITILGAREDLFRAAARAPSDLGSRSAEADARRIPSGT